MQVSFTPSLDLTTMYNRFMLLVEPFSFAEILKAHLILRITHRSLWQGSPWYQAVFMDESLNNLLKKTLRNVHQLNFENRAFHKMSHTLKRYFDRNP